MSQQFSDWAITEAMQVFGGGFVSGLGALWRKADYDNQARLKRAFPEYWKKYADPAMHKALAERTR